jgi:hypothetical protein
MGDQGSIIDSTKQTLTDISYGEPVTILTLAWQAMVS